MIWNLLYYFYEVHSGVLFNTCSRSTPYLFFYETTLLAQFGRGGWGVRVIELTLIKFP